VSALWQIVDYGDLEELCKNTVEKSHSTPPVFCFDVKTDLMQPDIGRKCSPEDVENE